MIKRNKVIKTKNKKSTKINKWIFWTPRIISILFILFLAMFSLDIFDLKLGFWGTLVGLFMHNIPVFILIGFLIIAWKWEWVGAVGFFVAGLLYILMIVINIIRSPPFHGYYLSWSIIIAGPAFVIGILWWYNWKRKRR